MADDEAVRRAGKAPVGDERDLAGKPLRYNTGASVLNPHFIAFADPGVDWRALAA